MLWLLGNQVQRMRGGKGAAMNNGKLAYGLNLAKRSGLSSKPAPAKRKPIFGGGDDSDDDEQSSKGGPQATAIEEWDDSVQGPAGLRASRTPASGKSRPGAPPSGPPGKSKKPQVSAYGDLSSALESRRYQEAAEELDPSVYDYDGVYDSLKPEKKVTAEDEERRPKYMKNLIASAAVRKRDALIAEEKKVARERDAEGEEFADKEKFVTEAYKKQQEEHRRLEAEERKKEEEEAKKNKGGGMATFYKELLDHGDQRHAEVMKAVEERAKAGPNKEDEEAGNEKRRTEADVAREINQKGGSIEINEDGQVVDKRDLLKGGLNVSTSAKRKDANDGGKHKQDWRDGSNRSSGFVGGGGKAAMHARQTRMMEEQLEQALKRSMDDEQEERKKVERAAKSRKTEGDISSAKERYLARKREAEEAKKKGLAD